jgi:tRNA A37 threonylcarbamoyladenosine synthetase subunit TsaC/SUA5/YrdC
MWNDPIIQELHRIREARAAHFNNNLQLMADSLKQLEQEWLSKFPQQCDRFLAKPIAGEIQVKEAEKTVQEVL